MKEAILKRCKACKLAKPLDCFYKGHGPCKDRYNARAKSFRATPEGKKWQHRHTERYNHSPKGAAARKLWNETQGAAAAARWAKAHPEYSKAYKQTEEGKMSNARTNHKRRNVDAVCDLTTQQWKQIKQAYCDACAYCGRDDKPLTIDHVLPVRRGGGTTASNVVPACNSCNVRKGGRTPEEWGVPLRPQGAPPARSTLTVVIYAQIEQKPGGCSVLVKGKEVWSELGESAEPRCQRLAELLNTAYATHPRRKWVNGSRQTCDVANACV